MSQHLTLPVVRTWDAWGAIFTDVDVWAPAVREICRRSGLPCHRIEPGYPGTNAVFVVNRDDPTVSPFVVKIYAPFCLEDFHLERALHPLLTERIPTLHVPHLLGRGTLVGEMDWPYILLSFLPGRPIREVRSEIPPHQMRAIARALGRQIGALHALPTEILRGLDVDLQAWDRYVEGRVEQSVRELRDKQILPPHVIDEIPDFVRTLLACETSPEHVLVNGDLTQDHLLLAERDGTWAISGLIDFADSLIAPRTYEWIALWFGALDRDPAALRAFMTGYDPEITLDAAFYQRVLAFTFLHEFGALIIKETLDRMNRPIVSTLEALLDLLWKHKSN
jgi:Ser/Thr protein kinase RdoA (MazF antagonist)